MKKRIAPQILFFCLFTTIIFSQKAAYSSLLIPPKLKENANAVIRNQITEITIEAVDRMTVNEKRVVTILNKVGDRNVDLYARYDNDTKITKLSARVYDALGNEVKKYSKGKFLNVSAVDSGTLYSDSRVKYVDYTPISYPYTVVFESEYKTSTGVVRGWYPINNYFVSVEKSEYKLHNPKNITITTKGKNIKDFPIVNKSSGFQLNYILNNQKAIKYEAISVSYLDFMPRLMVVLSTFKTDGVTGSYTNWKELGLWMNTKILAGKSNLDDSTKNEILKLVENIENPLEKAKIIYQYVQDKTRYISVQVGIGGIQPIAANQVDKVGYGDCKGLTNYTKALLEVVGVKSNYVHVEAGYANVSFEKDFASLAQGNHVILNIPNNGNDVWLECTSQTMPFGFLGNFTDDRNVLVITPEGGIIKRTPAYKNECGLIE